MRMAATSVVEVSKKDCVGESNSREVAVAVAEIREELSVGGQPMQNFRISTTEESCKLQKKNKKSKIEKLQKKLFNKKQPL